MIRINFESKDYFKEQSKLVIEKIKKDGIPVIIAGDTLGELYIPFFEENGVHIDNIYDNSPFKHGKMRDLCNGEKKPIIGPEDVSNLYDEYNAVILVPYYDQIKTKLNSLAVKPRNVFFLDFAKFHTHPTLFLDRGRSFVKDHLDIINEVYEMFEDERSKEIYERLINYWISGNYDLVRMYSGMQNKQYLDTLDFSNNEVVVNAGACDGRYSKLFIDLVGIENYKKIYNIECDPINFELLKQNLKYFPNMSFIKKGVWDKAEIARFNATGSSASSLDISGNVEIELDSIDNMFKDEHVSFIKADVEGAEAKMLEGARKTIERTCPKLAICCYHQIEDLWDIPRLIKEINPNYKIGMRHYTDTLSETVCYAY